MNLKYLIFTVVFASLSFSVYAADKPSRALAEEYVTIIDFQKVTDASLKGIDQQLFSKLPPKDRAELNKVMAAATGWPAIKEQVIEMVIETYTKDELEAYIAFVKTPAGASANAKNEILSEKFTTILGQNIQRVLASCCSQKK